MSSSTGKIFTLEDLRYFREQRLINFAYLSYYTMLEELFCILSDVEREILEVRNECGSSIERRVWKNISAKEREDITETMSMVKDKITSIERDIIPQTSYKKKLPH